MRITVFTVGTHGDARPFAALGRRLQALGHTVTIVTDAAYRGLIKGEGLTHHAIDADFAGLMRQQQARVDAGQHLRMAREVARATARWMPGWVEQGMAATTGADLVLGSGSATSLAASIAEARTIGFAQAQFMPLTPSRHLRPLWPGPSRSFTGPVNLAVSHAARVAAWRMFASSSEAMRAQLRLPPLPWRGPWYGAGAQARLRPVLYAFSRHLQPQPPDWPASRASVVGFWQLDAATSWTPPPRLEAFLEAGPPPVYVGFGSMRVGDARAFTATIAEAVRRAGRRAILATGWGGLDAAHLPPGDDICVVGDVPHDWLLPRVDVAVHHGGAGTVAAAARAGVAHVVMPFMADQFYWAEQLRQAGVNAAVLDRNAVTADRLAAALRDAAGSRTQAQARRLQALMSGEDGLGNAVAALRQWGLLPAANDGRDRQEMVRTSTVKCESAPHRDSLVR